MSDSPKRKMALQLIGSNIARHGHHVYVVSNGPIPRFAYTIGVRNSTGAELVLGGSIIYHYDEVIQIINDIASKLRRGLTPASKFECDMKGAFTLGAVHPSWASKLFLGAFDYFETKEVAALQILPDQDHWTIDIPEMSQPWSAASAPAWTWLYESWTSPVPNSSVATTNFAALRGGRITQVARWEADQWEAFAGSPPETEDEARVVPIGTLIGADESLSRMTRLSVGEGIWRDEESNWQPWGSSGEAEKA